MGADAAHSILHNRAIIVESMRVCVMITTDLATPTHIKVLILTDTSIMSGAKVSCMYTYTISYILHILITGITSD